jgi:hypothetical protein
MNKIILLISLIIMSFVLPADAAYRPYGEITISTAKEMIANVENPDDIVGIYDLIKGSYHGRFVIIPNKESIRPESTYVAFVVESPNYKEKSGNVKFFFTPTDSENLFNVEYYEYGDISTIRIERKAMHANGQIIIHIYDIPSYPPNIFVKTFSAPSD